MPDSSFGFLQIAAGMQYLNETAGIVHRDLAARNVLIGIENEDGVPEVRIADLGLAKQCAFDTKIYACKNGKKLLT